MASWVHPDGGVHVYDVESVVGALPRVRIRTTDASPDPAAVAAFGVTDATVVCCSSSADQASTDSTAPVVDVSAVSDQTVLLARVHPKVGAVSPGCSTYAPNIHVYALIASEACCQIGQVPVPPVLEITCPVLPAFRQYRHRSPAVVPAGSVNVMLVTEEEDPAPVPAARSAIAMVHRLSRRAASSPRTASGTRR